MDTNTAITKQLMIMALIIAFGGLLVITVLTRIVGTKSMLVSEMKKQLEQLVFVKVQFVF